MKLVFLPPKKGEIMGDSMRPLSFRELITWIFREQACSGTIFGIPTAQIYRKQDSRSIRFCSQRCDTPVGPAAGPHTQLSQNIAASYLAGGRFMELKTVQKLDSLDIPKPCIEARDEAYNVEWSSEHSLEVSFDEYLKAWFALHVLEAFLHESVPSQPSFIFNMSIGYDLEGIQTEKMQKFINSMADASSHKLFARYQEELEDLVSDRSVFTAGQEEILRGLSDHISPKISPSVTVSTMHGCPPGEIEAICSYLLAEKQLETYVKLNPTLLGYDHLRGILDTLGYEYVHITRETFDRDLQFPQAVEMLRRLSALAEEQGRCFGVKLSNTLPCVNDQGMLPGDDDMYMSGRALFPLTVGAASKLADAFDGTLPISYCGGAAVHNIAQLFTCGIKPITSATELLKPSGYMRLADMAEACDRTEEGWNRETIDTEALRKLAELSVSSNEYRKDYRWESGASLKPQLPMTDCYIAPCVAACPILQDVPEYLYLASEGLYEEALELIYQKNPLPRITGYICDHQCMHSCNRMYYEGAVDIRRVKRIAAEGGEGGMPFDEDPMPQLLPKTAVIGAGPAGLSAAYFLARAGFEVTVFEREASAGGIVRHVIPGFRLPQSAIEGDIAAIEQMGVRFVFHADNSLLGVEQLASQGYSYMIYAVGAETQLPFPAESSRGTVIHSLDFLKEFRLGKTVSLGEHVVVIGGGNTAMDSARAAASLPGVQSVTVLYRRTRQQMPADLEEYHEALKDGVQFRFLQTPEELNEGGLKCRNMQLGEADDSGRPRPVETDQSEVIPCTAVISAIGERPDWKQLSQWGVPAEEDGTISIDPDTMESRAPGVYVIGDAASGPSTIVRCSASARAAADAVTEQVLGSSETDDDLTEKEPGEVPQDMKDEEDAFFAELLGKRRGWNPRGNSCELTDDQFAAHEASRCLECSYLCNMCVEVCPNRANIAVDVRSLGCFSDPYQIIHIDAFCNECGNCEVFCPWEGSPYRDKLTIFSLKEDFEHSENPGVYLEGETLHMRLEGKELFCSAEMLQDAELEEQNRYLLDHVLHMCRHMFPAAEKRRGEEA